MKANTNTEMEPAMSAELVLPPDATLAMVADQLVAQAQSDGVALTSEGGLLTGLIQRVLQGALEAEITEHLGYERVCPDSTHTPEAARALCLSIVCLPCQWHRCCSTRRFRTSACCRVACSEDNPCGSQCSSALDRSWDAPSFRTTSVLVPEGFPWDAPMSIPA